MALMAGETVRVPSVGPCRQGNVFLFVAIGAVNAGYLENMGFVATGTVFMPTRQNAGTR